jgi:hypothetical protein
MIENEPVSLSDAYPNARAAVEYAEQVAYLIWPMARDLVAKGITVEKIIFHFLRAMDQNRDKQITVLGRDPLWLDRARQQVETDDFRKYVMSKLGMV